MRRVAVCAMAVGLALPGCGRSEGEEFREDSLRPLQQQLERDRARVAATLRVVRPRSERGARALAEDVAALSRTVRRIDGLVPPPDARENFDEYVAALRGLVARLRGLGPSVRRGDEAGIGTVARRVQDATGSVQQQARELEEALLDV